MLLLFFIVFFVLQKKAKLSSKYVPEKQTLISVSISGQGWDVRTGNV